MSVFVPIIMGSRKDLDHAKKIASELSRYGIDSEIRVASAHKATVYLLEILAAYESDPRAKVYVTVAGRSNALSGVVDSNVVSAVIACPPYSDRFGGADVFSSLRLPSAVAPAVVLEPAEAALLAAKILSSVRPDLPPLIRQLHADARARIAEDDRDVRGES